MSPSTMIPVPDFLDSIPTGYRTDPHALLQILIRIQHAYHHVPREAAKRLADEMEIPLVRVQGLLSFYSFLSAAGRRSTAAISFAGLKPPQPLTRLRHALNRNTRRGSRRNIAAHYDLGNDFYRLWLDSSMMYSSAIYSSPGCSLEDAQRAKLDRVIDKAAEAK